MIEQPEEMAEAVSKLVGAEAGFSNNEVKVLPSKASLKSEFFITLTSTPEFLDNFLKFSKSWTLTPS